MDQILARRIGPRIKAVRETRGLSQEQLASLVGCHVNTLGRWERDERPPSAYDILDLARALAVAPQTFLLGGPQDGGAKLKRASTTFYVNRKAMEELRHVTTRRQFRNLLRKWPSPCSAVQPSDEEVTEKEWARAQDELDEVRRVLD